MEVEDRNPPANQKPGKMDGTLARSELGLREAMSYGVPGGSGMRKRRIVVGAKCGAHNLIEEFTEPDARGGTDPVWREGNALRVKPHQDDDDILALTVWQIDRGGTKRLSPMIATNHIEYTEAAQRPNEVLDYTVLLYAQSTRDDGAQGGAGSGVLKITVQWLPDDEELEVTVLTAAGLVHPSHIVRDLTTYVDTGPVYVSVFLMMMYLIGGLLFYTGYSQQAGELEGASPELMERLQGSKGDWDVINTLVFMVTSFTTVGYGTQPSLVATTPPCLVPGSRLRTDSPFSILIPADLRGIQLDFSGTESEPSLFTSLPAACFEVEVPTDPECMVIADDDTILDFHQMQRWEPDSGLPPFNFSSAGANELASVSVPGGLGRYDCGAGAQNESTAECHARFAALCEKQMVLWRLVEGQKDVTKLFTVFFIMAGIGILGAVVGSLGQTLMDMVQSGLGGIEFALDTATDVTMDVAGGVANATGAANLINGATGAIGATVDLVFVEKASISTEKTREITPVFLATSI